MLVPVTQIPLDSSDRDEDVTLLHGKNLLLKLIEDKTLRHFVSQSEVAEFLATDDLCLAPFREAMVRMLLLERETFDELEGAGQNIMEIHQILRRLQSMQREAQQKPKEELPEGVSTTFESEMKFLISDMNRSVQSALRKVENNDSELKKNEETVRKYNDKIEVLNPTVILRCPKCKTPVFKEEAERDTGTHYIPVVGEIRHAVKCVMCEEPIDRTKALRTPIHIVKPAIRTVWQQNIWLEDYIARILRSLNWQTWYHVHVLGSSGVRHEIDVLGVKGSYALLCECKSGEVTRQAVFNFWAKVYDIRSHVSMLALIGKLPDPETSEFVAKNPSLVLVEDLGHKTKNQIKDELAESVLARI